MVLNDTPPISTHQRITDTYEAISLSYTPVCDYSAGLHRNASRRRSQSRSVPRAGWLAGRRCIIRAALGFRLPDASAWAVIFYSKAQA